MALASLWARLATRSSASSASMSFFAAFTRCQYLC